MTYTELFAINDFTVNLDNFGGPFKNVSRLRLKKSILKYTLDNSSR